MLVSNRNPAQLMSGAAHGCVKSGPRTGMSVREPSHILSGCACRSQSACALASPANV